MIYYVKALDGRKLDHKALEAIRMRAVKQGSRRKPGESHQSTGVYKMLHLQLDIQVQEGRLGCIKGRNAYRAHTSV